MSFRLREDAEKWFAKIGRTGPIKTDFDLYYFCLMAGFASGRSVDPANGGSTREFVKGFIDDYKPAQRLIIGLLIAAELRKGKIDLAEKQAVRNTIRRLVDPQSGNGLTDEGMKRLNWYASGGYEFLAEKRDKPYAAEDFLRDYVTLVGNEATTTFATPLTALAAN